MLPISAPASSAMSDATPGIQTTMRRSPQSEPSSTSSTSGGWTQATLASLLVTYYGTVDPGRVAIAPRQAKQSFGKEHALFDALQHTYGVSPLSLLVGSNSPPPPPPPAGDTEGTYAAPADSSDRGSADGGAAVRKAGDSTRVQDLQVRLARFYSRVAPDKVGESAQLAKLFGGSTVTERQLFARLRAKYGSEPDAASAPSNPTPTRPLSVPLRTDAIPTTDRANLTHSHRDPTVWLGIGSSNVVSSGSDNDDDDDADKPVRPATTPSRSPAPSNRGVTPATPTPTPRRQLVVRQRNADETGSAASGMHSEAGSEVAPTAEAHPIRTPSRSPPAIEPTTVADSAPSVLQQEPPSPNTPPAGASCPPSAGGGGTPVQARSSPAPAAGVRATPLLQAYDDAGNDLMADAASALATWTAVRRGAVQLRDLDAEETRARRVIDLEAYQCVQGLRWDWRDLLERSNGKGCDAVCWLEEREEQLRRHDSSPFGTPPFSTGVQCYRDYMATLHHAEPTTTTRPTAVANRRGTKPSG